MTGAGVSVHETVPAFALAAAEAAERVLAVVSRTGQFEVVRSGPTSYRMTRQFRPVWSAATLFIARTTEVCEATIGADAGSGRTVVFLSGKLPADTLHEVRLALGGQVPMVTAAPPAYTGPPMPAMSMPPAGPTSQGQAQVTGYPPQATGYPPQANGYPPQTTGYPPASAGGQAPATTAQRSVGGYVNPAPAGTRPPVVVEIDDGQRASLGILVLVGRNPAAAPDEFVAQLVAVDDPGRSVSKTHVAIGADERGVWVVDRHSTNGTAVLGAAGATRCSPGERVYLQLPATVRFGDRVLRVVAD